MKPVYLEFCGINSFSEKTEIDFRALLSGGVFGIFGDTGSGKSTILDSIHFALYGQIERSGGSECINYKLDGAYVIFDFEITTDGVRHTYRVKRERRRKNNLSKAWLYEYTEEGGLLALAEGTRDVNDALEDIIGLTFADFKMCIALPQGDFAALVKAPTSERVKLVSRLFDLEKYGERLFKAANEKYYRAEEAVNLVKAKMEQNDGGRDEIIAQKQEQLEEIKAQLAEAEKSLKKAESVYENAKSLQTEKFAYDGVCAELERLKPLLPEMERKRAEAERLPAAKAICREWEALEKNRRETAKAERGAKEAEENARKALATLEESKSEQAAQNYDDSILRASLDLEKVRGAEADLQAEAEAEKKYKACLDEYKRLGKLCPKEDFDGLLAEKERKITALGEDDTLLDYLKHNCKDVLLVDAYGEIRADLRALGEKYPQTKADVENLLEKYKLPEGDGRAFDIAKINLAFKDSEQKRKLLKSERDGIEKRKRDFEGNETQRNALKQQGQIYHNLWDELSKKNRLVKDMGSLSELEKRLKTLQSAKAAAQAKIDKLQDAMNGFRAEKDAQSALCVRGREEEAALTAALNTAIDGSGFASADEALTLQKRLGDENAVKAECKRFFDRYQLVKSKYEETDGGKFSDYDEGALARANAEKAAAESVRNGLYGKIAAAESELKRLLELREKYRTFEKELKEKEKEKNLCDELRTLLKGNKFLEYIASEYLQEICASASKTLLALTGGRYFLRYEKEFKVGDNLDGGNLRAVKTLSGGETFLVSLSLALSLSAAICLKSLRPIEFFFLDEGFGTLDEKLVDAVMDVLGKLSKNFAVGLISHVEELKHRIDNKILVTGANESHGSQVRMERF